MIGLMLNKRKHGSALRLLSVCMALLIAAAPMALCANTRVPAVDNGVQGINTITLFQSANDAGASGEVAASAFDGAIKWRLNAGGAYQATTFSTLLPAISRALTIDTTEGTLSNSDVQEPVTSVASAQKIATVMATDGFMLTDIDTYKEDAATHAISITVSGSLYSTSTGAAVRTFAVTGTALPTTADESDSTVMLRASDSAAAQIATTLGAGVSQGKETLPIVRNQSKIAGGSVLLVLLAAALAGVIAHNVSTHGSAGSSTGGSSTTGGGGSSTGGPPNPPGI